MTTDSKNYTPKHLELYEDIGRVTVTSNISIHELTLSRYWVEKNIRVSHCHLSPWAEVRQRAHTYCKETGLPINEKAVTPKQKKEKKAPAVPSNQVLIKPTGVCDENTNKVAPVCEKKTNKDGTMDLKGFVPKELVTVDDVLAFHQIDPAKWYVSDLHISAYQGYYLNANGGAEKVPMHSIKAKLSPKNQAALILAETEALVELAKQKLTPFVPSYTPTTKKSDRVYEICLFDHHFGRWCWEGMSEGNYNPEISKDLFKKGVNDLLAKASHAGFEKILFPIGNDFYNVDNMEISTTAGTRQDQGYNWQQMYIEGLNLIISTIKDLSDIAPVEVVVVPGNHDSHSAFTMGLAVEIFFNNYKHVRVNSGPEVIKYFRHGKVLLGFAHGKDETPAILAGRMSYDRKKDWSETSIREFHVGHLHHRRNSTITPSIEERGIVIRQISSLAPSDAWHNRRGYIGQLRTAEGFLWNSNWGLEGNFLFIPESSLNKPDKTDETDFKPHIVV